MKKFLDYINNLSEGKFITLSVLVALIFTVSFNFFNVYFNNVNIGPQIPKNMSFGVALFIAIIIGPILESILIVIVTKLIGQATDNKFMITFITAILFAGVQSYSLVYVIITFIPTFIFVAAYTLYNNNKKLNSFSIITIIHVLYNFMQILFSALIINILK